MSGAQRLSIVDVEIAETEKRRPNWLQIAIGLNIAIWAHAVFFLLLAWAKKAPEIYEGPPILISRAEEILSEWIYGTPVIDKTQVPLRQTVVMQNQWPYVGYASPLQGIQFPPLEDEDKLDLTIWFGPSMEF